MLFAIVAYDHPNSLDLRMKTRPLHLEYIKQSGAMVKLGGALLTDDGNGMKGSLIVIEAADLAAAKAWSDADPYKRDGVFGKVDVTPFRAATANFAPMSH